MMKSLLLLSVVSLSLIACKKELKEVTVIADPGTLIEYQIEPNGPSGSLTMAAAPGMSTAQKTIAVGGEKESITIISHHAMERQAESPILKAIISSSFSGSSFDPDVSDTALRVHGHDEFQSYQCKNLIQTRAQNNSVIISVSPPYSVGDCEDETLRLEDPLKAGIARHDLVSKGTNFFSEDDDRRMGNDFARNFDAKNSSIIVNDGRVQPYLQGLMNKIAANSDAPHIRPHVTFINADVVNAFALPGGNVYVFRGIMDYVKNENELVGILGHEWGHVAARHGTRNVSSAIKTQLVAYGIAFALELAKKENTKENFKHNLLLSVLQGVDLLGAQAIILAGSREHEAQADTLGAQYAYRTGFQPLGIAAFFQAMLDNGSGSSVWLDQMFSDHPDHASRVSANKEKVADYFPTNSLQLALNSNDFSSARLAMNDLPPMLKGKEANQVLAAKFVDTANAVSINEYKKFFEMKVESDTRR